MHVTHGGEYVNFLVVRHTVNDVIQDTEQAASGRSIPAKCPGMRWILSNRQTSFNYYFFVAYLLLSRFSLVLYTRPSFYLVYTFNNGEGDFSEITEKYVQSESGKKKEEKKYEVNINNSKYDSSVNDYVKVFFI